MATKKSTAKTGAAKKKTPAKKAPAKRTKAAAEPKKTAPAAPPKSTAASRPQTNQFWSVILTAAGVLIAILALVEGTKAWSVMHNGLLGFFGIGIFLVPFILFYTGYLIGQDRRKQASGRAIWGVLLTVFCSTTMQIFFGDPIAQSQEQTIDPAWYESFWSTVTHLYESGKELRGGGLISGVIAIPLTAFLGDIGAKIIVLMLVIVMLLLLTNKSIGEFVQMLCSPFVWFWRQIVRLATREFDDYMDYYDEEDDEEEEYEDDEEYEQLTLLEEKPEEGFFPHFERASRKKKQEEEIPAEVPAEEEPENGGKKRRRRKAEERRMEEVTFMLDRSLLQQSPVSNMDVDVPIYDDCGAAPTADEINQLLTQPKHGSESNEMSSEEQAEILSLIEQAEADADDESNPLPWMTEDEENADESLFEEEPQIPYVIPPLTLLKRADNQAKDADKSAELREKAELLVDTLKSIGVTVRITGIRRGPTVTRYEIQPAAGVKISKITALADDIGLNLGGKSVRIEAPIPGKPAVGVEVPNNAKDTVSLREILESPEFQESKSKLTIAVGKDIDGNVIVGDIAKMPHMIIAGTTGSGKSVCTNSIIMSILYHASPEEVRLLLIDPKVVEFQPYDGVPHLLIPVVTDPQKAAGALNWAVIEMERRYGLCAQYGVRDLKGYNAIAEKMPDLKKLPQIVIIIDEFADLMMTVGKEVEAAVIRIAQKARAAGIHLIIATQRPQADVITGLIKSNIPSRIGMSVKSAIDSRIILDCTGAETLLGNGDLLFYPNGAREPKRVQGCFCSDGEVEAVVSFLKSNGTSEYDNDIIEAVANNTPAAKGDKASADDDDIGELTGEEALCMKAAELAVDMGQLSTTALQRRLKLGYAKAARIVDELEERGIVGPSEGAKPRKVLMSPQELTEWKLRVAAKGNQVNSTGM
ncbi:MAG: DNA translocase FtsK 4TM domain-containing protein [Oscillospiraceae bacterium]|nr:DNA translocase FtsK 4TM domain-containing protein [Oscillospiraceae bacterium]